MYMNMQQVFFFFIKTGGRIYFRQLTANNHADHIFLKINAKQASDLHLFSQNYFAEAEFTCPINVLLKNFFVFHLNSMKIGEIVVIYMC